MYLAQSVPPLLLKRHQSRQAATYGQPYAPPLTTFRINTCKSVTKQTTLTIFRMNTYVKTGGGVYTN
jgi:hypothetical protein